MAKFAVYLLQRARAHTHRHIHTLDKMTQLYNKTKNESLPYNDRST